MVLNLSKQQVKTNVISDWKYPRSQPLMVERGCVCAIHEFVAQCLLTEVISEQKSSLCSLFQRTWWQKVGKNTLCTISKVRKWIFTYSIDPNLGKHSWQLLCAFKSWDLTILFMFHTFSLPITSHSYTETHKSPRTSYTQIQCNTPHTHSVAVLWLYLSVLVYRGSQAPH